MLSKKNSKDQTKQAKQANEPGKRAKETFTLRREISKDSALYAFPEEDYHFDLRDELGSLADSEWYERRLDELADCNLDETSGQILDRDIVSATERSLKSLVEQRERHKVSIMDAESSELTEADSLNREIEDKLIELEQAKRNSAKFAKSKVAKRGVGAARVDKPTGVREREYGHAASCKNSEAAGYLRGIRNSWLLVGIVVTVSSILDVAIFYEPVTATLWGSLPLFVGFICIACAVGPIVAAAATAHFIRRVQYEEAAALDAALTVIMAVLTVVLLAAGCLVRFNYWNDDTGVGLMLNVLAVALAVIAFSLEFCASYTRMALTAFRHEVEVERDLLELMQFKSEFSSMHESDNARRSHDDLSYHHALTGAAEACVCAMEKARKAIAKRVAKSPEQLDFVLDTPMKIGSQEIHGDSKVALLNNVREALGVPALREISASWEEAPNCRSISELQAAELADFDRRLECLRPTGAAKNSLRESSGAGDRPDEDPPAIPVAATVVS